jgi:predicted DNA-binding mobile mystery protein A
MDKSKLQLQQLNAKLSQFATAAKVVAPPTGWLKATRLALGMSLQQLANRLNITKQSMQEIENREKEGAITLKALREAAAALDMQLVYGLVPKDGSLDALIERRAHELATQIVARTSQSMKLEDHENSQLRLEQAITQKTLELVYEMPKQLWNKL